MLLQHIRVKFSKPEFHKQPWQVRKGRVIKVSHSEEIVGRGSSDFMTARVAVDLENVFTVRVPEGFWHVVKVGQNLKVKFRTSKKDPNKHEAYFVRTSLETARRRYVTAIGHHPIDWK